MNWYSWHSERIRSTTALSGNNLRRVARFVIPYWRQLLFLVLVVGVGAAVGVVPPLLIRRIIDGAIGHADKRQLGWLVLAFVGLTIGTGLLSVLQTYVNVATSERILYDLRVAIYRRLQSLSLKFFTN